MEGAQSRPAKKVWESSVQLYTVKCVKCAKWRLIPTKEKYEEIRENVEERPFSCETARDWRPEVSCEDVADINQDGNSCWAMDRPGIPQTPPGWQRIIRRRAEGGTKYSDVYYISPSNKRLRSMAELTRYLNEHLNDGVSISRFSFHAPAPSDENYVAKRRARAATSHDLSIVPLEVDPISWISPYENLELHSGVPESSSTEGVGVPSES